MRTWTSPTVPPLSGTGPEPTINDSSSGSRQPVGADDTARLYICGITPYDATHMGHAATYVMFDLLHRTLLDAGHQVVYCENVTDVDDPLLERADRDNVDWADLAENYDRLLADILSAHLSQTSLQQNEDMRRISSWAAMAAIPTMIAGIYGMNFDNMPELHMRYGYYVVLLVIVVACALLWRQLRKSGWI